MTLGTWAQQPPHGVPWVPECLWCHQIMAQTRPKADRRDVREMSNFRTFAANPCWPDTGWVLASGERGCSQRPGNRTWGPPLLRRSMQKRKNHLGPGLD